jgi:hypothetical protein
LQINISRNINLNMQKQKQESSTSKNINKNRIFQPSRIKIRFLLSKKKNENLQPPRKTIRTFNLWEQKWFFFATFQNKNKSFQPPIIKTRIFNLP